MTNDFLLLTPSRWLAIVIVDARRAAAIRYRLLGDKTVKTGRGRLTRLGWLMEAI